MKQRYWVEVLYRSLAGNPCHKQAVIEAEGPTEATNILKARVEKYKRWWKTDGGSAQLLIEQREVSEFQKPKSLSS